jgi:hypothetical protein
MFASKRQNGFVGRGNCFVAVSRETFFAAACPGNGDFNDRIYPIVAIPGSAMADPGCAIADPGMTMKQP